MMNISQTSQYFKALLSSLQFDIVVQWIGPKSKTIDYCIGVTGLTKIG